MCRPVSVRPAFIKTKTGAKSVLGPVVPLPSDYQSESNATGRNASPSYAGSSYASPSYAGSSYASPSYASPSYTSPSYTGRLQSRGCYGGDLRLGHNGFFSCSAIADQRFLLDRHCFFLGKSFFIPRDTLMECTAIAKLCA